jgi:hypothetical protein
MQCFHMATPVARCPRLSSAGGRANTFRTTAVQRTEEWGADRHSDGFDPVLIVHQARPRLAGSTVGHGLPEIRVAAISRIAGPWRTDTSTRLGCTYTLVQVAFRATCPLRLGTAPPELVGGAVSGTGAVLVAAGGGRTPSPGFWWRRSPYSRGAVHRDAAGSTIPARWMRRYLARSARPSQKREDQAKPGR